MRRLSDEFKKPEDFITQEDKESAPKPYSSEYTLESMKKHHDAVVYYKQRKGGEWFHGRISNAFRNGYDNIKWD
jgi:hypothetical protein